MLAAKYKDLDLSKVLLSPDQLNLFPKVEDREAWDAADPELKERWITLAEQYADYDWPTLKAEVYRDYWRKGDLATDAFKRFERRSVLGVLAMAECLEDKGRFLDQVINGIKATCEEFSWVSPGHRMHSGKNLDECMPDFEDHMVELHTASTADMMVWIRYLLRSRLDAVSTRICGWIQREVRSRLLQPYMEHNNYWWMGFREGTRVNNWNPWCNCSVLMGFLLLEDDPDTRVAGVSKVMLSLEKFIETYSADGCCDEGPGYWAPSGGGLFIALELLKEASEGKIDIFDQPLIRDIGRYIYKVHIHDNYFVDFADGDAKPFVGGNVVYRYGRSIGDEGMMRLGASRPENGPAILTWFDMYSHLHNLFTGQERREAAGPAPYARDAWFHVAEVIVAREKEGSAEGLFLAAKGGHNEEAHNHNDVGSFIVYVDGHPLFVDLGTEEYKQQTFSKDRYKLWYLQSQYHNTPTIRGVLQHEGAKYRAKNASYQMDDHSAELTLDIADAYPDEADIVTWNRTFKLNRRSGEAATVEVTDRYELGSPASDIFYSLVTPCEPIRKAEGEIDLEAASGLVVRLSYDAAGLSAEVETITQMDQRLIRNWGEKMYRIVLREKEARANGERTIAVRKLDGTSS